MGDPRAKRFETPKSSRGYEVYTYCKGWRWVDGSASQRVVVVREAKQRASTA